MEGLTQCIPLLVVICSQMGEERNIRLTMSQPHMVSHSLTWWATGTKWPSVIGFVVVRLNSSIAYTLSTFLSLVLLLPCNSDVEGEVSEYRHVFLQLLKLICSGLDQVVYSIKAFGTDRGALGCSWNSGHEGPVSDPLVIETRVKQVITQTLLVHRNIGYNCQCHTQGNFRNKVRCQKNWLHGWLEPENQLFLSMAG